MRDQKIPLPSKVRVRKELSVDALYKAVRRWFQKIPDQRSEGAEISLADSLMSGFAMFSLKDPSLLLFDERRKRDAHNLMEIYGSEHVPCDTHMRKVLDRVCPTRPVPLSASGVNVRLSLRKKMGFTERLPSNTIELM